jgi:hypothetical protein
VSSQMLNKDKTSIMFSPNTPQQIRNLILWTGDHFHSKQWETPGITSLYW